MSISFIVTLYFILGFKGRNPVKDTWLFTVQVLIVARSGLSAKRVNP